MGSGRLAGKVAPVADGASDMTGQTLHPNGGSIVGGCFHASTRRRQMKHPNWTIAALAAGVLAVSGLAGAQAPSEPPASNSHVPGGVINPSSGAGDARIAKAPQGGDAEFIDKAAIAGKAEVQASQLALKQAQSPDVRGFAKQMVNDHGKANARLTELAARKGMKPQVEQISDPDVEALRGKNGRDFDVAHVAAVGPDAHRKAVALFEGEARDGRDPQLREFASATLPTLRHHLSMAQALERKVGAR